ncbi:MAG TPA: small, acid-soluble spore protein, alpha/beta type [Desulfitobacteriaceae bacterium]|jgi:hypothetical protein|nr:small, acid-soluble spore protein, alpha/beta type [Desulfitobacteriaceae bacterium]
MQDKPNIQLSSEMEKFKYEVAQEIGMANRKPKKAKGSQY